MYIYKYLFAAFFIAVNLLIPPELPPICITSLTFNPLLLNAETFIIGQFNFCETIIAAKTSKKVQLYLFALGTGLRIGELLALKWADVDLDNKIVKVTKTLKETYLYDDNEQRHFVILELPSKTPSSIREVPFKRLLKKAALSDDFRLHDLRHTFATRLFEKNVAPKTVQTFMGHSTIETTMNIYTHVMKETKVETIDTLNDIFNI